MFVTSLKPVALCCFVAALTGCAVSPLPLAENFPLTTQKKVRSAGHWNQLSHDVVAQTLASLENAGATPQTTLYVALPDNASHFDRAFHAFLVTELVQKGRRVSPYNNAVLTINYQTQIVKHNSQRPDFIPGRFTTLTAGLYVLHGLNQLSNDALAGGILGVAGVADYAASVSTGGPTATELILTTTVTGGDRYLSRKTDVYYVEESDSTLFSSLQNDPRMIAPQTMKVVAQ